MLLGPTLLLYFLLGIGVSVAVYVAGGDGNPGRCWVAVALAVPFWPLYVPLLLGRGSTARPGPAPPPAATDEMAAAIRRVDEELQAALGSLDGWAEDVLAKEKDRMRELRKAWAAQSERIREMDRLLGPPEYSEPSTAALGPVAITRPLSPEASDRLRRSDQVRRQNVERLRRVRQRAYEDLMGTLAWVRQLVSMIHLAKFTGAPASRAEELVAQVAAAVEGLSELTWQDETVIAAEEPP